MRTCCLVVENKYSKSVIIAYETSEFKKSEQQKFLSRHSHVNDDLSRARNIVLRIATTLCNLFNFPITINCLLITAKRIALTSESHRKLL